MKKHFTALTPLKFLILSIVILGATPAFANYTYTQTVNSADIGKYYFEYYASDTNNCYAFHTTVPYKSQIDCQTARNLVKSQFASGYIELYGSCTTQLGGGNITITTTDKPMCTPLPAGVTSNDSSSVSGGNPAASGVNVAPTTPAASGGNVTPSTGAGLTNPLNNISSLPELLRAILKGVVEIGAIFLTVMIVYVGFLFVAAQGNAEKISSARSALVWTIIGGLLLLGASAIELVIEATVKTL